MSGQVKIKEDLSRELKTAYDNLPYSIRDEVKSVILEKTFWSESLFYHRLRGDRLIKPIEIAVIKKVFASYGVKIFE